VLGTAGASALDVQTTAGTLAERVQSPGEVTELVLSGTINSIDFKYIDESMPALRSLSLKNVTISATESTTPGKVNAYPANTIPAFAFGGSKIENIEFPTSAFSLGDGAFSGSAIKSLNLPANVANVGDGCFSGCPNLKTVSVGGGTFGVGVFAGCPLLESVNFSVPAVLPSNTFSNCTALAKVNGSMNIESIGSRAFADCGSLSELDFGDNLSEIGDEAFVGAGLTSVDLTKCAKLKTIGEWAFARMPRLTTLSMGDKAEMSEGMVFDCPNLKTFNISGATTEIPAYAYAKNASIDSAGIFNDNVTRIGNHSLHGVSGIETLTLPSGVEQIGDGAMQKMTGLKSLTIESATRPELGSDVWAGIDQSKVDLYVPNGQESDYKSADQWQSFNIYAVSGMVDAVDNMAVDNLKGRFVGDELQVSVSGVDIDAISVYDPSGVLLVSGEPVAEFVTIDMSGFQTRVFVVTARLSDGRVAALKIAKR